MPLPSIIHSLFKYRQMPHVIMKFERSCEVMAVEKRKSQKNIKRKKTAKKRFRLKNPRKLLRLIPLLCVPVALVFTVVAALRAEKPDLHYEQGDQLSLSQGNNNLQALNYEQVETMLRAEEAETIAAIQVNITAEDETLSLSGEELGVFSDIETVLENYKNGVSEDVRLHYSADPERIAAALAPLRAHIDVAPVEPYAEASLNENNVQRFKVYPGQNGKGLDAEATAEAILKGLASGQFNLSVKPVISTVEPQMTEASVKENTRRIATFTTRFRDSSVESIANRVFNITKAAGIINCCVIAPGEEWSFNDTVGLRSLEGGWKEAPGITGGKTYSQQAGGGICQVSTTLYNALLLGNINVTDRKAHSIPSDYVDKGLDATVDSGGIDLKFVNDTGAYMYIFSYIKPDPENERYSTITVSLYGKPLEEGVSYQLRSEIIETIDRSTPQYSYSDSVPRGYELETVSQHDGYEAEVYRDKLLDGEVVESQLLYTDKYRGNVAEILLGSGDPSTVKVPEGAVKSNKGNVG